MAGRGRTLTADEIAWATYQRIKDKPLPWKVLAKELRIDADALKQQLPPETRHHRLKHKRDGRLTPYEINRAVEMHRQGTGIHRIALSLRRDQRAVRAALASDGRVRMRQVGETHQHTRSAAAALLERPIGALPDDHPVAKADRAALRDRAWLARLDTARAASGYPARPQPWTT